MIGRKLDMKVYDYNIPVDLISKNGKIRTVPETEYQSVKEMIFKELAMFYIKLGKFVKGNKLQI